MTDQTPSKEEGQETKQIAVADTDSDVVDVPDPDEDDLDDLDDMLEEFSALKTEAKKPEVTSGPGRPTSAAGAPEKEPTLEEVLSDDDFAKELEANMAKLLGEIETTPEMQSQFEAIFKEISAAAGTPDDMPLPTTASASASTAKATPTSGTAAAPSAAAGSSGAAKEADFQQTIRRTMERMQASGEQATAAATEAGTDDILSELMKAMQSGGLDGAEGGEEEFSKLLLGMMEQLTNKDILYEPMKELDEKFPAWMEKNRGKVSAEDLKKYEEQQSLAKEIVAKFEEPTFSDANPKDREYIVDRMQKMQAAGSPPPDLVGDMPSAQDAFNGINGPDESCNPQ